MVVLAALLICLPPLQALAQPKKEREKRLPKPPRTDAPTIKEDLQPVLTTKVPPSSNLPNPDEVNLLKAEEKFKKNFVESPSTQGGFRGEVCKRDKGEKKNLISQATNRLDQLLDWNEFSDITTRLQL